MAPAGPATSVRSRAAVKLVLAGGASVAVWLFLRWLASTGREIHGPDELIAAALPGAYALVGLVELLTGVRFATLSAGWDSLRGWRDRDVRRRPRARPVDGGGRLDLRSLAPPEARHQGGAS